MDIVFGGVEGAHPADDVVGFVPVVEEIFLLEGMPDGGGELDEDAVGLDGVHYF